MSSRNVFDALSVRPSVKCAVAGAASVILVLASLVVNTASASADYIPATMILSATPWNSTDGVNFSNVDTVTMSVPTGDPAPTGAVTFRGDNLFSANATCEAPGSSWTYAGVVNGFDTYVTSCAQGGTNSFLGLEEANYDGNDYGAANVIVSVNLLIEGSVGSGVNSYEALLAEPATAPAPTGLVTYTDSAGGSCASANWQGVVATPTTSAYELLCNITTPEPLGTTISATYGASDFSVQPSNTVTVAELSLAGPAVTSATGNSYTGTFDSPHGAVPTGDLDVSDSSSGGCSTGVWSDDGGDGSGGELFAATCQITTSESGGATVTAQYGDDIDMITATSNQVIVTSVSAGQLQLSGSPIASPSGNSYTVILDAPTDLAPTGAVTVTDDAVTPGSCSTSSWTALQSDGQGGEDFVATCPIATPETARETVRATYVGSDYTSAASNLLTVTGVAASGAGGSGTHPASQAPLEITTVAGHVGTALLLATSGGSGTGTITYILDAGSAPACDLSGDALNSSSAGVCLITATKAADATYASVSSSATPIPMVVPARPRTVAIGFTIRGRSLNAGVRSALLKLSLHLLPGASVTVTGYAKGSATLARMRADMVARYLKAHASLHVTLRTSTGSAKREVTIATTRQ